MKAGEDRSHHSDHPLAAFVHDGILHLSPLIRHESRDTFQTIMVGFAEFQALYVESAAYHEAGHLTAAADQGMPLRDRGIRVDPAGNGIAYYWHREPGDSADSQRDREQRERTIVALYAGRIAQQLFFPDTPQEAGQADDVKTHRLLDEMHLADRQGTARTLCERAKELVERRWPVIESLARNLLARPISPQPQCEIEENWSNGQTTEERRLNGPEVVEFFNSFGIATHIVSDEVGTYEPPDQA